METSSAVSLITELLQLVKKYERGDMPKEDWLDKLAFRKMEEIHAVRLPSLLGPCSMKMSLTLPIGRS